MQERRKQPRKDLMSYSQVFNENEGYLIGYLGDLNALGAMVISHAEMKAGTDLTIRIQLPELEGFSDSAMTVPARVAWCQPDISPDYNNIGLEFKSLTERQKRIVEAIIARYEFRRQGPAYPTHPNQLNIAE